jgi:hypothetical protein
MAGTFIQKLNKPYHAHSIIPAWFFIVLLLMVTVNLSRLFITPINPDTPIDFKPFYVGQQMIWEGRNPYPDSLLKEGWKEIVEKERITNSSRPPGLPLTFLLYPPHALGMFGFLSFIPYKVTYILWYLSLPLLLAAMVLFIAGFSSAKHRRILFADLFLIALAFKGTVSAMLVGQPTFACLAICFAGLYYYSRQSKTLAGILLGLGTFKITLVMPFVLFMLYKKQYRVLIFSAITGLVLIGGSLLLVNDAEVFRSFFANVEAQRAWIFDLSRSAYPLNYEMITLTELGMIAEFLVNGSNRYITWINLLLIVPVLLFLYIKNEKQRLSAPYLFLVLCLLMLLTTYHLFYDCLLLLPLYFIWQNLSPGRKLPAFACLVIWMIPLNGLLNRFSHPEFLNILYFSLPLSLLLLLILLLSRPIYEVVTTDAVKDPPVKKSA